MILADVSVLIALAWEAHEHHRAARRWFAELREPLVTCAITQLGFLRVSTNAELATLSEARAALQDILSRRPHEYWEDALEPLAATVAARGPKQLTDAYLVSLAQAHQGKFATFDREIGKLPGVDSATLILVK